MAAVRSFSYKGFRIVCTVLPAPGGKMRGMAEILKVADGLWRDHQVSQVGGTIFDDEREALESIGVLAKDWVDGRW
ncbi:hypothetical protein AB870_26365 [Pandoraea faecigallinarum]|uniref:hypothetical protein n=1 Tax=Pandoraea faecigallinarum TaxID=656179 RepID=UPI0008F5AC33|nr:hypothetical protein [Pandoraea faecigallinarum]AOX47813.1 hypothetical protein AB870_26365 [Pandoraea faecigallinarum]